MADAWIYQGYKLKHLDLKAQKACFETVAEDLEKICFPPELVDMKIPKKAKYEIEHYLQGIVRNCHEITFLFPSPHGPYTAVPAAKNAKLFLFSS